LSKQSKTIPVVGRERDISGERVGGGGGGGEERRREGEEKGEGRDGWPVAGS